MKPLDVELKTPKNSLEEFKQTTLRVLGHLPNVISGSTQVDKYSIYISEIAGTKKYIRPVNSDLFLNATQEFLNSFEEFEQILESIEQGKRTFSDTEKTIIDSTVYTLQQSIGVGLDLQVGSNSARKHVGNRFEELIKAVFTAVKISNKKEVLNIPYREGEEQGFYKCENDLILSPFEKVKSNSVGLNEEEVVVSIKTTSKDRMGKIFIDKMLLERFVNHPQKVIGIFLNDIQRKGDKKVNYTLVSNLFMVYSKFLVELEGVYYLDPPPHVQKEPFKSRMKRFSDLLTQDIWKLLTA